MGDLKSRIAQEVKVPSLCQRLRGQNDPTSFVMFLRTAFPIFSPKKLEAGLRTNSAGIPYTLLLRIEVIGFPTFGLLLYCMVLPR